ncbi:MAG: hypothetical protein QOF80_1391 [Verrucomicrobiota bacterium]|jgi:uncharacterized lipoprotein YajG
MVAGLFAVVALLIFASCAGTTTAVGVTTNQTVYEEEKNPR